MRKQSGGSISPRARTLIDEAVALDGPTAEDRRRVRRAVYAKVGIGAATTATVVSAAGKGASAAAANSGAVLGGSTAAASGSTAAGAAIGKWLILGAIAVAAGGSAYVLHQAPNKADNPATSDEQNAVPAAPQRPKSLNALAPKSPAPDEVRDPDVRDPEVRDPEVQPAPSTATLSPLSRAPDNGPKTSAAPEKFQDASSTNAPSSPGSLRDELAVLRDAQQALQNGDAAAALKRLDEGQAAHPGGMLAEERDAARSLALCELAQTDSSKLTLAKAAAALFGANHPSSPHLSRIINCVASLPQ